MKKLIRILLLLFVLFVIAIFTIEPFAIAVGNSFSKLHRNGYFIPKESSIYKFRETKANQGSGEYWLYGEDDTFYFALEKCDTLDYSFFKKEDVKNCPNFDPHDIKTWCYCSLPSYQDYFKNEY